MVYIIERPGHGRTGYRIDTFGPPPPPTPFEAYVGENGMLQAARREGSRWPGNGEWDDPATFQLMGQVTPAPPPLGAQVEDLCRKRGIELLEKIGPSVLLAASAGSIFAWTVADARPDLVKGIVCVEGIPPTSLQTPLHFDPPVKDVGELALKDDWSKSLDLIERFYSSLQAEPARQLPHLAQVPIAYVHGDETIDPRFQRMVVTATDFLRQAGCSVDLISLTQEGIFGNTHFMPLEINNLEVLNVLTRWIRNRIS
jgi:pimeloyl-ACP methyl ester carboxylesterase